MSEFEKPTIDIVDQFLRVEDRSDQLSPRELADLARALKMAVEERSAGEAVDSRMYPRTKTVPQDCKWLHVIGTPEQESTFFELKHFLRNDKRAFSRATDKWQKLWPDLLRSSTEDLPVVRGR